MGLFNNLMSKIFGHGGGTVAAEQAALQYRAVRQQHHLLSRPLLVREMRVVAQLRPNR